MRPFDEKFSPHKLYWAIAGSSSVIELAMFGKDISAVACSGDNGPTCEEIRVKDYIRHQLDKLSDEKIIGVLEGSGLDLSEEEMNDRKSNEERLIWCAAWNAADDDEVSELGEIEKSASAATIELFAAIGTRKEKDSMILSCFSSAKN